MTFAIQITMYIFFCLLNVITKMLNTFFGELYLIVNNSSDHKNMRNCRVCPQVMNKKIIFAFNVIMLILLFLMLHTENIHANCASCRHIRKLFDGYWIFSHCAFQETHHPNTKIIPAITRDFHSFYAENVIAQHKEWCSVNTTVKNMLRLHFYF